MRGPHLVEAAQINDVALSFSEGNFFLIEPSLLSWSNQRMVKKVFLKNFLMLGWFGPPAQAKEDKEAGLWTAAVDGKTDEVERLLADGAEVKGRPWMADRCPLLGAASRGYQKIVTILLDKGADVNVTIKHGETPLHRATEKGHREIVKILLDKGANTTSKISPANSRSSWLQRGDTAQFCSSCSTRARTLMHGTCINARCCTLLSRGGTLRWSRFF